MAKRGLWANIQAKRRRIAAGSGERMRKKGEPGAPTEENIKRSQAKGGAWTRKEGKNPKGGLNAKGRASLKAEGRDIKRPQPEGGKRRNSFCKRMCGMKRRLTSAKTARDPNSRINKSLRVWKCGSCSNWK